MIKAIHSSPFIRQVLHLVSGTAVAQLILIGSTPLLARLFLPEAFGIVATYTSIVAILSMAACLRYELAIVIPEAERDAANLFLACSMLSLLSGALWLVALAVMNLFPTPNRLLAPMGQLIWLIPLAVAVNGMHLALNSWNIRMKRFRTISSGKVLTQSSNTGAAIGAGFSGFAGGGALVISNFIGHVSNLVFLALSLRRTDWGAFREAPSVRDFRSILSRFRNFPKYSIPSGFFNTVSTFLPILGLGIFFSATVVGWYAFTMRILLAPMSLIGGGVSQALSLRMARAEGQEDIADFVEKVFKGLFSISIFGVVFILLMGEELFTAVFGSEWEKAGTFAQIVAPWTLVWFVVSPMSILFEILQQQKIGSICQLIILLSRVLGLGIGALTGSAELTVLLLAVFGMLALLIMLYQIACIASLDPVVLARATVPSLVAATGMTALLLLIQLLSPYIWLSLISGLLTTAVFTTNAVIRRMRPNEAGLFSTGDHS